MCSFFLWHTQHKNPPPPGSTHLSSQLVTYFDMAIISVMFKIIQEFHVIFRQPHLLCTRYHDILVLRGRQVRNAFKHLVRATLVLQARVTRGHDGHRDWLVVRLLSV